MIDQNLLERVNPVFNTAKMTIFQLTAAGDKDAAAIAEKLNLTFEQTQNSASSTASPEQMAASLIVLETRYRTMETLALNTGYRTIIDLPCGYTPRAITLSREGIEYYGLDLPAAIAEAAPVIMSLIDEDKRASVHFCGVDATNGASLKEALKGVNGPVCINTEGLLMYFTDSEVGALCDNIHMILEEHGGCWLVADIESAMQYILTTQAIVGDRFLELLKSSRKAAQEKSDVELGNNSLNVNPIGGVEEKIKIAMQHLASHGLKVERLIIADHMPEIKSMSNVTAEQAETIMRNMKKCAFWKITPMDKSVDVKTSDLKAASFDMKASVENGTLVLPLKGRVDTLTAPNMLALFERVIAEHNINAVEIDCSELGYISSAGLRVLLIMEKKCNDGVKLKGINDTVNEILEQTGFDSVLDIIE